MGHSHPDQGPLMPEHDDTLPPDYQLQLVTLRSGGHPDRPFAWRIMQRIQYRDRPGHEHLQVEDRDDDDPAS